jgi:hypothetical protein
MQYNILLQGSAVAVQRLPTTPSIEQLCKTPRLNPGARVRKNIKQFQETLNLF